MSSEVMKYTVGIDPELMRQYDPNGALRFVFESVYHKALTNLSTFSHKGLIFCADMAPDLVVRLKMSQCIDQIQGEESRSVHDLEYLSGLYADLMAYCALRIEGLECEMAPVPDKKP